MPRNVKKMTKCRLCGDTMEAYRFEEHLQKNHPKEVNEIRFQASKKFWAEVAKRAGFPPFPDYLLRKGSKGNRKRYKPEQMISVREFLTGEHRTKDDLPRNLERVDLGRKRKQSGFRKNSETQRYLGSGKRKRWLDDTPKKR